MSDMEVVLCRTRMMIHALFPPPPFINNEQYGEVEMSQVVVFVYVFALNFTLTISPLEVC